MKYEDLLSVPYKEFGRDKDGMDCYGFVIELCRRNNTPLLDFICHDSMIEGKNLSEILAKINVHLIPEEEKKYGDLIQWEYEGNLHVGFFLGRNLVIHMTFKGVRITPLLLIHNAKYGRVEKWQ